MDNYFHLYLKNYLLSIIMSRIYLIIPYYGEFPNYFQLYLDSLGMNENILTIILITDINLSKYKLPKNIIVEYITLNNIREYASIFFMSQYNIKIKLDEIILKPYKLCDYRPLFFILFENILKKLNIGDTDYVGWGDCDVIYGKLSNFIDLSKNYDIIGYHGHFTAIKNIPLFTQLYTKINNLPNLLIDNINYIIDESHWRKLLFDLMSTNNYNVFYMWQKFCDVLPPFKDSFIMVGENNNIKYLYFNKVTEKLIVILENNNELEVTYCHLQKRKMSINFINYHNFFYIFKDQFSDNI